MLPWWLLFACIVISSVSAFYMILTSGDFFPMRPSGQPWARGLWILDYSGGALMAGGLLALKPPSLSPLARRMVTVIIFELAGHTAVITLAPWLGTGLKNLAMLVVYSVALLGSLAFVLIEAWRKSR